MSTTQEQLALARSAKKSINTATTALKNQALEAMANQLLKATKAILTANQVDMEAARGKISEVMLDRLFLDQERIAGMAQGIRALIDLPDPIGEVLDTEVLENGLEIQKVRVAMGCSACHQEWKCSGSSYWEGCLSFCPSDRDRSQGWVGRSWTQSRPSPINPRYESSFQPCYDEGQGLPGLAYSTRWCWLDPSSG